MYEYGPPEGKRNPLSEHGDKNEYKFVPLKDQLAGITSSRVEAEPVTPTAQPQQQHSTPAYRTGVLEQTVSTTVSLLVSGLLVAFMTVMVSYGTLDLRINMLIILGVAFLVFSLVSLFGSHLMFRKKKEFSFFRAFNGLTIGSGIGFIFSTIIFMVQISMS